MLLEVQAQVQQRLAHQAISRQLQRDQQAPEPSIAIEEWVDGFELHMSERGFEQRWCRLGHVVEKVLELLQALVELVRRRRNSPGVRLDPRPSSSSTL